MGQDLTVSSDKQPSELRMQFAYAKLAAKADIIPYQYKNKPSDILVAVNYGASMGLSFSDSLYRLNVIQGKPTMSAELVASQVRKAGHRLRVYKDEQKQSVRAVIVRADDPEFEFSVVRDQQWAHRMGLDKPDKKGNPSNYLKQPMTMLTWRAITAVAREACPEALYGAGYTPDELHDMPDESKEPEEPVDVRVVASPDQRGQLMTLLQKGGVDSAARARIALKALIGVDSGDIKDVPDDDVLMMLDAPDLIPGRVKDALWNADHPDIEPPHEAQESAA